MSQVSGSRIKGHLPKASSGTAVDRETPFIEKNGSSTRSEAAMAGGLASPPLILKNQTL
jgi:hypothetical protein